nr:hypothetical protein QOL21_02735 [Acholeplasma laidlawii]
MRLKVKTNDLDYQGQGVTRIDDKVTFIKGMFDDEVGIIEITKSKRISNKQNLLNLFKKIKNVYQKTLLTMHRFLDYP